jgi:hypothetical protein
MSGLTHAMASNTAAPRPTDTTENDAASHSDTAHTKSSGLENSPLGRLPRELRDETFSMAMTHPSDLHDSGYDSMSSFFSRLGTSRASTSCRHISWALNIMATCKEIRSETEGLLFSLNDISIDRGELLSSLVQLERAMPLLRRIPRSLSSGSGRVVLHEKCTVSHYKKFAGEELRSFSEPGVKRLLARSSQAIRPFQLFLDLDMAYHNWGGAQGDALICRKDAPVTLNDCSHIHNIIPADDRMAAPSQIDQVVDGRLELLQRHCLHRICPVRATLRQFESGLERSRQFMRDIVNRIFEIPDDAAVERG